MNRHSPEFKALVKRLQAGELTRKEAAEQTGVSYAVLSTWLSRAGVLETLPGSYKNPDNVKASAGDFRPHSGHEIGAEMTPEKAAELNAAVQRVLSGAVSARAAARETGLSHVTIAAKVRNIRIAQGLPVQARRSPLADNDRVNEAVALVVDKGMTAAAAADQAGVPVQTVRRALRNTTAVVRGAVARDEAVIKTLLASLKTASEQLGLAPKALCNQLGEML